MESHCSWLTSKCKLCQHANYQKRLAEIIDGIAGINITNTKIYFEYGKHGALLSGKLSTVCIKSNIMEMCGTRNAVL